MAYEVHAWAHLHKDIERDFGEFEGDAHGCTYTEPTVGVAASTVPVAVVAITADDHMASIEVRCDLESGTHVEGEHSGIPLGQGDFPEELRVGVEVASAEESATDRQVEGHSIVELDLEVEGGGASEHSPDSEAFFLCLSIGGRGERGRKAKKRCSKDGGEALENVGSHGFVREQKEGQDDA